MSLQSYMTYFIIKIFYITYNFFSQASKNNYFLPV